jgi:segregation and condensation protein A
MYNIKLEQFEGPLDLLMQLIDDQKLDITRVSLAKVADQYLEFIGNRENITLENLSNFLSVASRLILIKSKALLPMLEFSDEEEAEIKDLEWQLREYKKFKDVVGKIGKKFDASEKCFTREGFQGMHSFFYPPENINAYDIKKAYLKVLLEIPILEKIEEEMVREVITLEQKIGELQVHLRERVETSGYAGNGEAKSYSGGTGKIV